MKKFLSIALAVLMLLPLIAGCTPTPAPAPETDAPETDAPETDAPETEAPETDAPETDAPETDAPETDAPETDAPETDAPETDAPETDAPELISGSVYTEKSLTFAYPEGWSVTEASVNIIVDLLTGNNITVVYEAKHNVFDNITTEEFNETWVPLYLLLGMDLSDVAVDHSTNGNGVNITTISFMNNVGNSPVKQTQLIMSCDKYTYTVTVTEITAAEEVIELVFDTIDIIETDAPETEAPETDAPETEAPETDAPETDAPETDAPDTDAPETDAPETAAPETEAPETDAPETEVPETDAPETDAPETDAPETDAPETDAPETDAPETDAPEIYEPKDVLSKFGYYSHTASNGTTIAYRLYIPEDYNRREEYPVLVIFHSEAYCGTDNEKQMAEVEKFFGSDDSPALDCIVIAPQYQSSGGIVMTGESFVYVNTSRGWTEEGIDAVVEILDMINDTYSTDLERQYFTGYGAGGSAVWNMICRYHEKISAAVICSASGGLIAQSQFNEGNPIVTKNIALNMDELPSGGPVYDIDYLCISRAVVDIPLYYLYENTHAGNSYTKIVEAINPYKKGKFFYREFSDKTKDQLGATYISKEDGYKYLDWLLDQRRETE